MRHFILLPLVTVLLVAGCSKETSEQEISSYTEPPVIAQVDGQVINETSFQRAYLPLLLYGDKFDSEQNREDIINFLIGQKILSGKAREAELDTMLQVRRSKERVERKALARQLYQEWVRKSIHEPTEAELRQGFQRGKRSIYVRHLFAENEADIRSYAKRLKNADESFYTLAQDVFSDTLLSRNGGALGWVTFGDLDENLEDTLYTLEPGQISEPVQSQYGWHILSMDDSREEVFITEQDYLNNRDLIRNKIIQRREHKLGSKILNDFMASIDIQFDRDIARQVWPIVVEHLNPEDAQEGINPEFSALEDRLKELKGEVLLRANGEPWTVAQILGRLPELDRSLLYGNLYVAASNIIRDEMLVREAMEMGLDKTPSVQNEVNDAVDQTLADTYVMLVTDTLDFNEIHLKNFYEKNQMTRYHAPDSLQIELFAFSDSLLAAKALYQLRNGLVATNPGDRLFWISGADGKLYQLSRSIAVGTMIGPLMYDGKWSLVKLISRKRFPLELAKIKDRVMADMEQERFNTTRNILLDDFRPQHEIIIDHEALNR